MSMDRLHALAFNELTAALSDVDRFVAFTERQKITRRVVQVAREETAADLANALRRAEAAETKAENAAELLDEARGEMQEMEAEIRDLKQRIDTTAVEASDGR